MTRGHHDILLAHYPQAVEKVKLLKSFDPNSTDADVMDPIGLSLDVYRYVRDDIAGALWGLDRHLQAD